MNSDQGARCRAYLLAALKEQMANRAEFTDWIERERFAIALAANEWAAGHGLAKRVTVADVERIEVMAVGHVDYASKLALYVAEFVLAAAVGIPEEPRDG